MLACFKSCLFELTVPSCLQDAAERTKYDERHGAYREYLIRRLRLPAGVVYGHGLVNLGVLQVPVLARWESPSVQGCGAGAA